MYGKASLDDNIFFLQITKARRHNTRKTDYCPKFPRRRFSSNISSHKKLLWNMESQRNEIHVVYPVVDRWMVSKLTPVYEYTHWYAFIMPEVLSCMFTETARSKIGITLGIVNWVCVLTSLGLIGIGLYIKLSITKFTNLIEGYDGDALVYWLITVGIISVIINIGGGFCCFIAADPSKRDTCKVWLLVYFISSVIMCFLTLIGGSMCYASISHLERSFSVSIIKIYVSNIYALISKSIILTLSHLVALKI